MQHRRRQRLLKDKPNSMSRWPAKYWSLYEYLTNWCDYTCAEATAEVRRAMAADGVQ
jgi:hypothetical protein